jgi:hypothetical protein
LFTDFKGKVVDFLVTAKYFLLDSGKLEKEGKLKIK